MFCSKCGEDAPKGIMYCPSCGGKVTSEAPEPITDSNQVVRKSTGKVYAVLGWLFFAISLLVFPIIFAAGSFIMGVLTFKQSKIHGVILMVLAIVGFFSGAITEFLFG
jgi:uncharacterized membrane protein YvbJ